MNSLQPIYYEESDNPCIELFPKKIKYNPEQFDSFYDYCLQNPFSIFIITTPNLIDDIPISIPCIIINSSTLLIKHNRFNFNTKLISNTEITKKQIRDILDTIPKYFVLYPITPKRPNVFWQYPVITEKFALEKLTISTPLENKIYVGLPFATLIDKKLTPIKELASMVLHIQHLKTQNPVYKVISACQHIHYMKLIDIFTLLQIDDLYISHKRLHSDNLLKINLHGLPLYPVNIFDSSRQSGLNYDNKKSKKYLFSFIGAYMKHYLHPIRSSILEWKSTDKFYIENTKIWHFEKDVYENQVLGKTLTNDYLTKSIEQQYKYNEVLSNSEFSLCPVGAGPNTIRLWESICVGSIPIIIADEFTIKNILPISFSNLKFYIQLPYNSKYLKGPNHLKQYLQTIPKDDIELMRHNCKKVAEYLRETFITI